MKQQKLIIVGARGMLGRDLGEVFEKDGQYQVLKWDREEIDITDQAQVKRKVKAEKPDVIINVAAYNAVDKAENDPAEFELAKRINGEGPRHLTDVAKELNAIFVHYVSDYVFDGQKGKYVEEDATGPICNYGISKQLGEENVKAVGGKYYLIRTSKLFGRPVTAGNSKKSFFQVMLELAREKDELKVVDSEKSCFTFTPDLAQATKTLIEEEYPFGIYHLINEGAVTWYQGAKKLFELAGIGEDELKVIPVGSDEFPRPAKRPPSSVLINTKFPKLRNYEQALEEWLELL